MALAAASGGRPFDHAVDAAEAWAKSGPPLPLATASLWHLGQQLGKP
jgi:hypothetical protein